MVASGSPARPTSSHGARRADACPGICEAWFGALFAAFPDFTFEVLDVVASGEKAAVRWHATGTFYGTAVFEGLAPNGASVDVEGCDVLTVRDGKVVRNDAYMNGAEMLVSSALCRRRGPGRKSAMTAAAQREDLRVPARARSGCGATRRPAHEPRSARHALGRVDAVARGGSPAPCRRRSSRSSSAVRVVLDELGDRPLAEPAGDLDDRLAR